MYIEIDDLVGNAFIPYLQQTGKRILSLKKINAFGEKVVKYLNEKEEKAACLRLSRDRTNDFFYEYADLFKLVENGDENLVVLVNDDITATDLIHKFSGYLSLPVLLAFRNEENTKVLF